MKTAKDFMDAANAAVPRMDAAEAIAAYTAGGATFIDVRDSAAIAQSGTIKGAHRIPRGMIEFRADVGVNGGFEPRTPECCTMNQCLLSVSRRDQLLLN